MRLRFVLSATVALFAISPAHVKAINFQITDLGTLGGSDSVASAINSYGDVVGSSYTGVGNMIHAFCFSGGVMQDLGTIPGGGESHAYGINDSGQIVGTAYSAPDYGTFHAFLYSDGTMQDLNGLTGREISFATGVNSSGDVTVSAYNVGSETQVAGSAGMLYTNGTMQVIFDGGSALAVNDNGLVVGTVDNHAYLWDGNAANDLGTLAGTNNSEALGVNANGLVVGESGGLAFLYDGSSMQALGALAIGGSSNALGLNTWGQVVGWADASSDHSVRHAFLYDNGVMVDLNTLVPSGTTPVLTSASAINDAGQIAGEATINGHMHAVLMTPATPGDLNGDGIVNAQDIAIIASHWLQTGTMPADANDDGIVNAQDIAVIAENWLQASPVGGAGVPEPAADLLAALAIVGLCLRRYWQA